MIGILTGASAFSGLYLYEKLLFEFVNNGALFDRDFPEIMLYNYPFHNIDEKGVLSFSGIKEEVDRAIFKLNGCSKIVVACNSLHGVISDSRVLDLPGLVRSKITKRTLVLCSQSSAEVGLFGDDVIYPDKDLQNLLNNAISKKIKNEIVNMEEILIKVVKLIKKYNINLIIIGCTELSMLNWNSLNNKNCSVIDVVDEVIDKILFLYGRK